MEESLCELAVVYPDDYDFRGKGKAGIAKLLSEQILVNSGFYDTSQQIELLEYYREEMGVFERQAEAAISLVFPQIREEEMLTWTQEKFMRTLAKAEWVMRTIWQMPFEFTSQTENKNEDEPEVEPPSLQDIAYEIRGSGGDPMVVLKDQIIKRRDEGYVAFPMIGGPKLLKNEEVLDIVRKQIQRLS